MPYAKGNQSNRKTTREDTIREEDLDHESEPVARDVITSPISSASSYSSVPGSASSAGSSSGGSSVSSEQLELILAANNRALADSMAANTRTMEASMTSLISTLSPAVPVAHSSSVAPSASVKIPKWSDDAQPSSFFHKLETALTHNGVDKATWGRLLPVYLSGQAESAFAQVDRTSLSDYDAVKAVLLEALGDTTAGADRRWWTLARQPGEEPAQFYLRVRSTGLRMLSDFSTRDAVVEQVILSRFLSLLPADGYGPVTSQHPKTGLEAARLLQEFEETKAYSWKRQGWRQSHHSGRREPSRGSGSNGGSQGSGSNGGSQGSGSNGGGRSSSPSKPGGSPTRTYSTNGAGVKEVTGSENFRGGGDRQSRKPIICHGCGEPGHIRPQCPNRVWNVGCVRSTGSPVCDPPFVVDGCLAGALCSDLQIDTGAEKSVVNAKCVPKSAYLGRSITLGSWKSGQLSKHQLAKLKITVGEVSVNAEVAVAEQLHCSALLGLDLGAKMKRNLLSMALEEVKKRDAKRVVDEVPMQVVSDEVPMQVVIDEVPMQVVIDEVPMQVVIDEVPMQVVIDEVPMQVVIDEVPMQVVNDGVPKQDVVRVNRAHPKQAAAEEQANACKAPAVALEEIFCFSDSLFEPEVACDAPAVALEEIFCFSDTLFEPEVACDAPAVAMDDTFCLSVSPFEPEEAGDASVVALEDIFWPDLGEVEFPLPGLDDDVVEASVAPACSDTFVVPRQLKEVKDEVLEVLEASVAPVCCTNIVVPRHLEEVRIEVLEAGVASVDSDKIVVPMQQVVVKVDLAVDWVAPADAVSDAVSDTVCDNFNLPEEFFVEDQADVVASGPVDCKPMVGLDVSDFVDSFSETDPVLAPVPVARPEPEKVVIVVILAMEDSIPPKLCWQSPTVLVDHCLRFICCYTKATGKFAPGSCAVILVFDMFILVISAICSFCSCISMCLSKFLVVLFFGAFGPRAVPLLHGLDDPPWRMLGAPSVSWILDWLGCSLLPMWASPLPLLLRPLVNRKGGGDVMESPSQYQQLPNISCHDHCHDR